MTRKDKVITAWWPLAAVIVCGFIVALTSFSTVLAIMGLIVLVVACFKGSSFFYGRKFSDQKELGRITYYSLILGASVGALTFAATASWPDSSLGEYAVTVILSGAAFAPIGPAIWLFVQKTIKMAEESEES
jgi:hypothetical protein